MSEQSPQPIEQNLNISDSILETVQIGGIAGRDQKLTQIQGGVGTLNVFGLVKVDETLRSAAKTINQEEYRRRRVLLDKVKNLWIDGILANSLHKQVLIDLGLEERREFVQNQLSEVQEFPSNSVQVFPTGTTAADIFEGIGAGRTLLILGEPGCGKTVTLLKLAESLIARSENDLSQPLPVVVNLSSWAKQRKSIIDWLVQEIHNIYKASKSLAKIWVEQEQLILLLDGLDEVNAKYRNDCVKALNQFIQTHGLTEIVVCTRIHDYENLSERLKLRSAIYLQSLTSQQIDQFLERAGESLFSLKTFLQNNTEIRALASSPLILSIMSLAYQGCLTEDLPQSASLRENFHQKLFDDYIKRMFYRRQHTNRQYEESQTLYWLAWLASKMVEESQTVFFIEEITPKWLNFRQNLFYGISTSLITSFCKLLLSFFYALPIGFLLIPIFVYIYHSFGVNIYLLPKIWFAAALIAGFVTAFIEEYSEIRNIKRVEILRWSWVDAISTIKHEFETLFDLKRDNGCRAICALLFGWPVMIPLFILSIVSPIPRNAIIIAPQNEDEKIVPNQGVWNSLKNSIIGALIGVLISGLLVGMFDWWSDVIITSVQMLDSGFDDMAIMQVIKHFATGWSGLKYLVIGLSGLVGWLFYGGRTCIQHFNLRFILSFKGYIPWNYAHFLDYATERIFMQKIGGGYIFIHRMLMEYFAQMELERK